jgi:hypothetical protein
VAATFIHIDRFHLDASDLTARIAGWGWVVLYATLAVVVAWALFVSQRRVRGSDGPPTGALAPSLRWGFAAEGAVLVPLGGALYAAPGTVGSVWPLVVDAADGGAPSRPGSSQSGSVRFTSPG